VTKKNAPNPDIPAKPWKKSTPPKRVLVIRLQAMGDVVITLPYLQALRHSLPPQVELDFLTREETETIPQSLSLFNKVISIGGGRDFKKQVLYTLALLPALFLRRYDVIIDLQNNLISKIVRRALFPRAWSLFDRYSPNSAGERNRRTIEAAGLGANQPDSRFLLKNRETGPDILKNNGWNGKDKLVLLNPAGAFATRHWDMNNYVMFARLWLKEFPGTRFLVLGTAFIAGKAAFLEAELGDRLINLVGKTTPAEAFAVMQQVTLALSEDSGLMHMAWTSGIPTVVLFGSTRSDWARPLGEHAFFLDSSDLPCGNCMKSVCTFGDVHCMTRHIPEVVFRHSFSLIQKFI